MAGAAKCPKCGAPLEPVATLTGLRGANENRKVEIRAGGLRVGRTHGQNDLVIADPELSRAHARFEVTTKSELRLVDSSTNGTWVNGQRIKSVLLQSGWVVRFGISEENAFVLKLTNAAATGPALGTIFLQTNVEEETPRRRLQLIVDQYAVRDIPLDGTRLEFGGSQAAGRIAVDHPTVAARHAEVLIARTGVTLRDLGSPAGTFVNRQRIQEHLLQEGDLVQLGNCETHLFLYRESRPRSSALANVDLQADITTVGRDAANTLVLSHPTISTRHAEFRKTPAGIEVVDLSSTNGTYINGERISRQLLRPGDRIALGALVFVFNGDALEGQTDGKGIRLEARNLVVEVQNKDTGAALRTLDDVSLIFQPREFIALLGPSGAGKSTLMNALNGSHPANSGSVTINGSDLYRGFDSLRSLIGYLPQEDVLHRQLTVSECLTYSARLRLPDDFTPAEISNRVNEVIADLQLAERAGTTISSLSGGQRKRVSLGIELISKPSLLFVDEPTAGQDPLTEAQMMQSFREIANRGATVVINTHLLGSFSLLDKVAVLVKGELAYFGPSEELLPYFSAERPQEIFRKLQHKGPKEWASTFRASEIFRDVVEGPLQESGELSGSKSQLASSNTVAGRAVPGRQKKPGQSAIRQWVTLLERQLTIKLKDKVALAAILLPPLAVGALLGWMKTHANSTQTLFMLVVVSMWFGCSASVREIVDELPVFRRERQGKLKLTSYLGSKLAWVLLTSAVQAIPLVILLSALHALEGDHLFECLLLTWIMAVEGGLVGLLISASFNTAEKALYAFPLALIPQLLLAGILMPTGHIGQSNPFGAPFFTVQDASGQVVEVRPVPSSLRPPPLDGPAQAISALMTARWGIEALADLFVHDDDPVYSGELVNGVNLTLHPNDNKRAEAAAEAVARHNTTGAPFAFPPRTPTAFWRYLGILGIHALAYILAMSLVLAIKGREKHAH